MRIFYDTEFTDLTSQAELISAGFVTEYDQEFYIEFDGIHKSDCSEFVLDVVYPMLRAPGVKVASPLMAAQLIVEWLQQQASEVVLVSDSNWDISLISQMFHAVWAANSVAAGHPRNISPGLKIRYECISLVDAVREKRYFSEVEGYFLQHPGMQHHALSDARASKRAVMRMEGFY